MLQPQRSTAWRMAAVAVVAGGLGAAGGAWLTQSHAADAPLAREAAPNPKSADRMAAEPPPAETNLPGRSNPELSAPAARPSPAAPARPGAAARPAQPPVAPINSTGVVSAVTPDPAGFTYRTESGEELTVRVLDSTVFAAGADRPYNFGQLKTGDAVKVRITPAARADTDSVAGSARPTQRPHKAAPSIGEPVARQVMVRPAGERPFPQAGQPGAATKKGGPGNGIIQ